MLADAYYGNLQGDTKGNAKGGDASAKKDGQPNPNSQVECIFSFFNSFSRINMRASIYFFPLTWIEI